MGKYYNFILYLIQLQLKTNIHSERLSLGYRRLSELHFSRLVLAKYAIRHIIAISRP